MKCEMYLRRKIEWSKAEFPTATIRTAPRWVPNLPRETSGLELYLPERIEKDC
jgi:hypothetical protein